MTKPIWRAILKDFGGLDLTEPLGLVFDPEAQTRRELVAERLIVEVSRAVIARSGSDVAISSLKGKNKSPRNLLF